MHDAETPDRDTAEAPRGALAGIRIVDLSRVLAGPLCTQMLADHGAEVIKVEALFGDETRGLGPPFNEDGDAAYYTAVNRGKQALAIDLAHPDGQATLLSLIERADVVVENFIPGTMARWQLDYDTVLRPRFPRLVYCSISGFGGDGPLGGLPGYDAILQAMCGLMSVNGEPASGPTKIGIPIVDHLTAYTALSAILMALLHRHASGRGQRVEATLFDAAMSLLVPHAANWLYSDRTPELLGSAHPNIAPYDRFDCLDGAIFLGILNDRQFRRFCVHLDRPALAEDERFLSNAARLRHRDALRQIIEQALASRRREALCSGLMKLGVPVGPVNTVPEAFAQAHTAHRAMLVERGTYRGIGLAAKLLGTPGIAGAAPPRHGQHSERVLVDAGLEAARIAELKERGVIRGLA